MNRLIVGLPLLLSSVIIYGSTLISAAIYSGNLKDGWDSRYGVFGTALREVGQLPITFSILLALSGILIILDTLRKKQ